MQLVEENANLMAYPRFERRAVENVMASREAGHYVAIDVDYVHVTPPGGKDVYTNKVSIWLSQLKTDASQMRIPREWVDKYHAAYDAWKKGQELPLEGTPIRGWGVCSPAQQETLIKMNVLTVEQLAALGDEGTKRLGMAGLDLKNKATAWLKQLKKAGAGTMEIAALRRENDQLQATISTMEKKMNELARLVESLTASAPLQAASDISADDLLGDD